jgi:hypothetical protein
MYAVGKKHFKGQCSSCGKRGHKSADCRNKNGGNIGGRGGDGKESLLASVFTAINQDIVPITVF